MTTLPYFPGALDAVYNVDALELLRALPEGSVDAIITDLPYGTTACSWDEIIPFEPMWAGVKRVLKPRGVFVTTASQPFTSKLVMSNPKWLRETLVWDKRLSTGFLDAKRKHLKRHEDVLVFCQGQSTYEPEMVIGVLRKKGGINRQADHYGKYKDQVSYNNMYYPTSILEYPNADRQSTVHPTQKPVALYRYLVRTYTQPGDVVLDFCCGSGTTALAAREEGRRFIAGDTSADYVAIANKRLSQPYTPSFMALLDAAQSPEPSATEAAA